MLPMETTMPSGPIAKNRLRLKLAMTMKIKRPNTIAATPFISCAWELASVICAGASGL